MFSDYSDINRDIKAMASCWGVIGFFEAGLYGDDAGSLTDNPTVTSYGAGIRYQVTKDKKLNLGIDVAFSSDETSYDIQVGEAF